MPAAALFAGAWRVCVPQGARAAGQAAGDPPHHGEGFGLVRGPGFGVVVLELLEFLGRAWL